MLSGRIDEVQKTIYALAGEDTFNINSTQQLGGILFDKLGLPPVKKTKTGYSTKADVLEKLQGQHPIIDSILEYRQLTKLKSTYVDGLGKVIGPDGRIHTSFQNTVTATGRNCGKCSPHPPERCWWTPTTPRLSCGCWPIWPGIRP